MKSLKLLWAAFFILIIYLIIGIIIKYYVDWLFVKNAIWIIIISLSVIVISRLILHRIAFLIGNIRQQTETLLSIAAIIDWIARILYLAFVVTMVNSHGILISIFCYLLFYVLSNFFTQGYVKQVNKQKETLDQ